MNANKYFNAGDLQEFNLQVDKKARQAVHVLRGYAYQCVAAALEWVDLSEKGRLYLEVAEDYAILADTALHATQVKDTKKSGAVTLNSAGVRKAINTFVELVEKNPGIDVELHFMTTSEISTEQVQADRPAGKAGLFFWEEVKKGADVGPLRPILESGKFDNAVSSYCQARGDTSLRNSLIRKIHWHCGQPDYATLREELESRMVVVAQESHKLPPEEARRLVPHLIYRVLETSTIDDSNRRVLTRADFYDLISEKTTYTISRISLESLLQRESELLRLIGEQSGLSNTGSADHSDLFIDSDTLPVLKQMIPRSELETSIVNSLCEFGVSILVGGSGVGKSVLARRIAAQTSGKFYIVYCRDMDALKTLARLNAVFSRIGGLSESTLILEDLIHLDDRQVTFAFGQVAESVLRRGGKLLVTCYREPSLRILSTIGLDQNCIIDCPYFTEEEASMLVEACGGESEDWGKIAFFAGRSGHPQLTHAFVVGMSGRGWPIEEIPNVITSGLSSEDTEAVRDSVRLSLTRDLSDSTRNLLYRLSFTVGQFKRSFALSIASISPEISRPGECMDQLVGPWIEAIGKDRYRISPLASGVGGEVLTFEEQKRIHRKIAEEYFKLGKIDVFDINSITFHALTAGWSAGLAKVGSLVLFSDSRTLAGLAEHAVLIRYFNTDRPIYPNDWIASTILRLAQFALATETLQQGDVSGIVAALFNEIEALPSGELKDSLEALAVLKLISTLGIAKYVENWVNLLTRSIRIIERNEFIRSLIAGFEGVKAENNAIFIGQMFCVGSSNLTSVEQLETIVEQLDSIDNRNRNLLLTPIDKGSSDYSLFINAPWASERHDEEFDVVDAEARYARMAETTLSWGIRPLTSQCWAARSVLLNEYLNNKEKALLILEEAVETLGHNPILDRAQATVHWHQGEYKSALKIYRTIAENIGKDSPVERTFALRQAAICAANCGEWLLAKEWFLDGQQAAACLDSDNMIAMAIGLGADASASAFRASDTSRALTGFLDSVEALENLDPTDSLAAAYCHRVIRHAVLWFYSSIEGTLGAESSGETIELEPGSCSNPEPPPAIRDIPLGHIDCTWYTLAESEISANTDVGINSSLYKRLTEGMIPTSELSLRLTIIQKDIINLNVPEFLEHFMKYIETTVHYSRHSERLKSTFSVVSPTRENIPTLDSNTLIDPIVEQVARGAVLGFAIHAIMLDQPEKILELETELTDKFGNLFPSKSVFDQLNSRSLSLIGIDRAVVEKIQIYLQNRDFVLRDFYLAGLRFLEWINQSNFRNSLMLPLAIWQRSGWIQILEQKRFQIINPLITVTPVVDCLENSKNNLSFVAQLLLVSSDAAGVSLSSAYRESLVAMKDC